MAIFSIEDLSFSYPTADGRPSLRHVTLSVEPGEYVALLGKSGSGKTTLLRHLKTVLAPHGKRSGRILFDGAPLEEADLKTQAARIGYVMQDPDSQIVTDKVWHELAFGLESLGCDETVMRLRVAEMASYFGIQDWFHREVSSLSGGQKQLLSLASVMAMQPDVLLLDEPTSQLDPIAASDFLNTVRKINRELGTTVILTEHRLEDVLHGADRAVVLEEGRVVAEGTPREAGARLFTMGSEMFSAMPAPMRVYYGAGGRGEDCPLTVREGRRYLSSRFAQPRVRELPEEPPYREPEHPVLEFREAWFRYEKEGKDILRGVNFALPEQGIHAIVGGNGAGKSTLLKAACGILKPYRGSVRLFGKPLSKYKSGELYHGGVAMLPQDPRSLFVKKTAEEELLEMLPSGERERVKAVTELCGLEGLLSRHPYDLSGGEQQRLALAKVLLTEPKVLLLDEPTKGIDSFFKRQLAALLGRLRESGKTVLMVSHDVEFCAAYADAVSMFFDGAVLATAAPRRFFERNSFYTTAAGRMSRHIFRGAVTAEDVVALCRENAEGGEGRA